MRKAIVVALGVLCATSVWAAGGFQPLDVKVGLWETSVTTQSNGTPPIPPEMIAKLTPEQRAKFEAMMKQRQAEGPRTETVKKCMTKEDLEKTNVFGNDDKECTKTVVTSTPRKLEGKIECTKGGGKQSGTFHIEALDASNVKGTTQMVMTGNGNTMNVNSTFTSKWLASSCGAVK
jgi:hypothetical protein